MGRKTDVKHIRKLHVLSNKSRAANLAQVCVSVAGPSSAGISAGGMGSGDVDELSGCWVVEGIVESGGGTGTTGFGGMMIGSGAGGEGSPPSRGMVPITGSVATEGEAPGVNTAGDGAGAGSGGVTSGIAGSGDKTGGGITICSKTGAGVTMGSETGLAATGSMPLGTAATTSETGRGTGVTGGGAVMAGSGARLGLTSPRGFVTVTDSGMTGGSGV